MSSCLSDQRLSVNACWCGIACEIEASAWSLSAPPCLIPCALSKACWNMRWTDHPAVDTLVQTLQFIERRQPRGAVLENVMGLLEAAQSQSQDQSPLDFIRASLQRSGYHMDYVVTDLSLFHTASRQRCCLKLLLGGCLVPCKHFEQRPPSSLLGR